MSSNWSGYQEYLRDFDVNVRHVVISLIGVTSLVVGLQFTTTTIAIVFAADGPINIAIIVKKH